VQGALVVAQVALSVTLLTGSGLLVRTLLNLYDVDVGADLEGVLTVEVPVAGTGRSDVETRDVYERMRQGIRAIPGVAEAGVGSAVPLRDNEFELEIKAEDVPSNPDLPTPRAEYRTATPEFFRAAGIPLLAGRDFQATDTRDGARVVILNRSLAESLFGDLDPLGRRVAWTGDVLNFIPVSGDWRTVVGIVGDTRSASLDTEPRPAMYQPFEQETVFAGSFVVRAQSDPEALLLPATQVVRQIDPSVPIGKVGTLAELREESVAAQRINALLVSGFAVVALLIAAVGLAGVLGFSVSQRTGEIGVRMSLGAEPAQVRRMVVGEGAILLAVGLVLGAIGSLFASGLLEGMLFGVAPNDPTTLLAVVLVMGTVGVTAAWVPAMRASSVQPVEALRRD
jgi:predicted permease